MLLGAAVSNKKIDIWVLLLIAAMTAMVYVAIVSISPMNGEDYALTRPFVHEGFWSRARWILARSHEQTVNWNARFGEQLAIFWLSVPKIYYILAAVISFVLLNYFVATIVSGTEKAIYKTCISMGAIFAIWPGMEVFFWTTANAGYLQPVVLSLFCIYLYRSDESIKRLVNSWKLMIVASVVSFVAGLSFENTPIAIILYMSFSLFFVKDRIPPIGFVPILTLAAGWVILLSAPSTSHRREFYNNVYGGGYSVDHLAGRVADVVHVFFNTSGVLFASALIALVYINYYASERKRIFLSVAAAALVVSTIVAAPYTEPRSFSLAWALMFSIIIAAVSIATSQGRWVERLVLLACVILFVFPLKTAAIYFDFAEKMNQRDFLIKSKINTQDCVDGVKVKRIWTSYHYRYLNNRDEWYYRNPEFIRTYYGCKVVMD